MQACVVYRRGTPHSCAARCLHVVGFAAVALQKCFNKIPLALVLCYYGPVVTDPHNERAISFRDCPLDPIPS